MRTPDADIPKASQGELTVLVADAGGVPVVIRHPVDDGGVNDPQFQALPVRHRFQGISGAFADRVAAVENASRLSRAELLAALS